MPRLTRELHECLTEPVLESLRKKNILTTMDFISMDNVNLEKIVPLTFPEIQGLKRNLVKKLAKKPISALDCYNSIITHSAIFKTGIQSLDDMLKGGILSGNIVEICGLPASGKSTLIIKFIQNNLHTGSRIYVIDTKNDIVAKRIMNSSKIPRLNMISCMEKLFINKIFNKYDFVRILYDLKKMFESGTHNIRILIIDSLASLFLDSKNSTENNNLLNNVASLFRFFINEYHLAIIVTNLITEWKDENSQIKIMFLSGRFWSTVPNIKLKLEKNTEEIKVTLTKDDNSFEINKTCSYNLDF